MLRKTWDEEVETLNALVDMLFRLDRLPNRVSMAVVCVCVCARARVCVCVSCESFFCVCGKVFTYTVAIVATCHRSSGKYDRWEIDQNFDEINGSWSNCRAQHTRVRQAPPG